MRRPFRGFILALCLLCLAATAAQALEVPPHGGQFVVDTARLLPAQDKDALGAELRRYAEATGNRIVVLTIPGLEGEDIAAYANRVARGWGVGQKDANNGVLILVAAAERKMRFEVGRGIEDRLPDITAKRIQQEVTLPHFKARRFGPGLAATVAAIEQALGPTPSVPGEGQPAPQEAPAAPGAHAPSGGFSWLTLGLLLLAAVLVIGLLSRRGPRSGGGFGGGGDGSGSFLTGLVLGLLSSIFRGRGGGGFGGGDSGGDGGFSGGGGDFGGGGSSSGFGGDD